MKLSMFAVLPLLFLGSCASQDTPMARAMGMRLIQESQPQVIQTANGPLMVGRAPQREASDGFKTFFGYDR